MDFLALNRNLRKDYSSFPLIKVAFASNLSTQLVARALRGHAWNLKQNLEIYEMGLGTAAGEIRNPTSGYYNFSPEYLFIYHALVYEQGLFYRTSDQERSSFYETRIIQLRLLAESALKAGTKVIICSLPEVNDFVYGSSAHLTDFSFSSQVRKFNDSLISLCRELQDSFLLPFHAFAASFGYKSLWDPQLYYTSSSDLSLNALPAIADFLLKKLLFLKGGIKKCIVLDLDNTLWGGVAGDDGWENLEIGSLGRGKVFTDLQYWLRDLKNKGILLAVNSKNDENIAREVFRKHPEMILREEDFVVFAANWNSKSGNLDKISKVLNLGMHQLVYLDDNPAEREQVGKVFPEICIPDLPKDPALWIPFLTGLHLFEVGTLTNEDLNRTEMYRKESARREFSENHSNLDDYLKGLEMLAVAEEVNSFNLPRLAQLTQRTNQFNLRTIRYTEHDILQKLSTGKVLGLALSLRDKFGEEGLVSFILLEKREATLFIDTWVMSCRVFGRGLENLAFDLILKKAAELGYGTVEAEYLPTPKNKYVENLLPGFGFTKEGSGYLLRVDEAMRRAHFISAEDSSR